MKLGFTGTREGMTEEQKHRFLKLIIDTLIPKYGELAEFHHGDCVGADADAHHLIQTRYPECCIIAHPSTFKDLRAFVKASVTKEALPSKDRNQNIVTCSSILLACPKSFEQEPSGTWQTINMGLRAGKEVFVLAPDGRYRHHEAKEQPKGLFK